MGCLELTFKGEMAMLDSLEVKARAILAEAEKSLGYPLRDQLHDLLADNTNLHSATIAILVQRIKEKP
ncbi:MAG: hypothetical protein M0Z38_02060 [Deltaproteobacteria bacterium]|nr:hypothetical protein [Deltaproteobacteria bacterium]